MTAVTLVVLTYNRAQELARTLEHSLALPARPHVIVIDNGSSDGTAALVRQRFARAELVRLERNIGAAARNIGVERALTPYVAFSDDDTRWAAGSLARGVELLESHPGVAVLTARVLIGREEREDPVSTLMARSPLPAEGLPGPALLGFLAGASLFRRNAFLEAGGYEPRFFLGGEETLLSYDLAARGWVMVYCDRLTVHHYPSSARDIAARRRILARNALWVTWLRRPWRVALCQTLRTPLPSLLYAFRGLPWALRNRRVLPPNVEALCRLVDAQVLSAQRFGAVPRTA